MVGDSITIGANLTRQEFLRYSMAAGAVAGASSMATAAQSRPRGSGGARTTRPNILLIVTDQERAALPPVLPLPGHDLLRRRGTTFDNYFVHTAPCGPSRSNIYTGQHTQRTGVFMNPNSAPFPELPTSIPTIGTMLKQAGYRTAYKGKWHLSNEHRVYDARVAAFDNASGFLDAYGFGEFNFDGDKIGLTWEGFQRDEATAADAAGFIHSHAADDEPWFMAVNFVNPHDIMWFDATGHQEADRARRNLISPLMPAPGHPLYRKNWRQPLPLSFYHDDLSEKPASHRAELATQPMFYGRMDHADTAAWENFQNYYFNCVVDLDRQLKLVLDSLDAAGCADNTIVIYTSDHGERAGAHGMRQKGATVYDEDLRVPFTIIHPDVAGGGTSERLAGAVDIAPTILGFAGVGEDQRRTQWPALKGVDIAPALGRRGARTARDDRGILFNYAVGYGWTSPNAAPGVEVQMPLPRPDLSLRRLYRGVFDGRYKFARYFAPNDHHLPEDWAQLSSRNDLELYDMRHDPHELTNLAVAGRAPQDLMLRLNGMTNALIREEVGADDGGHYTGPYALTR